MWRETGWRQIAHLGACPRSCNSQSRRVQDCAGSLMEEVAKADTVSARPDGVGWSEDTPRRGYHTPTGASLPKRTCSLRAPQSPGDWSLRDSAPLLPRSWTPLLSLQEKKLFGGAGAAGLG